VPARKVAAARLSRADLARVFAVLTVATPAAGDLQCHTISMPRVR